MDVTITIEPDGRVDVTVSDDAGYNPEVADDLLRRCRETAYATQLDVCGKQRNTSS